MENDPDVMMAKYNRAKRTMFISVALAVVMMLLGSLVLDIMALGF